MKIKTADLIGPALDWAVATIEGYECQFDDEVSGPWLVPQEGFLHDEKPLSELSPSTNWSQGGPIIEQEKLEVRANDYEWQAFCFGFPSARAHSGKKVWASGPTPLIAAIRCFVTSKLGDEVDIPEELLT